MRLAVITSSNVKSFPAGETLVLSEFTYDLLVWDETPINALSQYDCILLRTCWDYHLKYPAFRCWLGQLKTSGLNVVNPVQSLIWNSTKSYLIHLSATGIPVVPTYTSNQLEKLLTDYPHEPEFIVKPLISATAYNLRKIRRSDLRCSGIDHDSIIQPFIREIQENGEWSLIFFGTTFSHSVRKRPQSHDFRVQSDFGGSVELIDPPEGVSKLADLVISTLPVHAHYCRVDIVQTKTDCLLMEIEMIEPELFIEGPVAISNYKRFISGLSKK